MKNNAYTVYSIVFNLTKAVKTNKFDLEKLKKGVYRKLFENTNEQTGNIFCKSDKTMDHSEKLKSFYIAYLDTIQSLITTLAQRQRTQHAPCF